MKWWWNPSALYCPLPPSPQALCGPLYPIVASDGRQPQCVAPREPMCVWPSNVCVAYSSQPIPSGVPVSLDLAILRGMLSVIWHFDWATGILRGMFSVFCVAWHFSWKGISAFLTAFLDSVVSSASNRLIFACIAAASHIHIHHREVTLGGKWPDNSGVACRDLMKGGRRWKFIHNRWNRQAGRQWRADGEQDRPDRISGGGGRRACDSDRQTGPFVPTLPPPIVPLFLIVIVFPTPILTPVHWKFYPYLLLEVFPFILYSPLVVIPPRPIPFHFWQACSQNRPLTLPLMETLIPLPIYLVVGVHCYLFVPIAPDLCVVFIVIVVCGPTTSLTLFGWWWWDRQVVRSGTLLLFTTYIPVMGRYSDFTRHWYIWPLFTWVGDLPPFDLPHLFPTLFLPLSLLTHPLTIVIHSGWRRIDSWLFVDLLPHCCYLLLLIWSVGGGHCRWNAHSFFYFISHSFVVGDFVCCCWGDIPSTLVVVCCCCIYILAHTPHLHFIRFTVHFTDAFFPVLLPLRTARTFTFVFTHRLHCWFSARLRGLRCALPRLLFRFVCFCVFGSSFCVCTHLTRFVIFAFGYVPGLRHRHLHPAFSFSTGFDFLCVHCAFTFYRSRSSLHHTFPPHCYLRVPTVHTTPRALSFTRPTILRLHSGPRISHVTSLLYVLRSPLCHTFYTHLCALRSPIRLFPTHTHFAPRYVLLVTHLFARFTFSLSAFGLRSAFTLFLHVLPGSTPRLRSLRLRYVTTGSFAFDHPLHLFFLNLSSVIRCFARLSFALFYAFPLRFYTPHVAFTFAFPRFAVLFSFL